MRRALALVLLLLAAGAAHAAAPPDVAPWRAATAAEASGPSAGTVVQLLGVRTANDQWQPQTTFAAAGPLRFLFLVRNTAEDAQPRPVRLRVFGADGSEVAALRMDGEMRFYPGDWWWCFRQQLPADLPAGEYRYVAELTSEGITMRHETTFTVQNAARTAWPTATPTAEPTPAAPPLRRVYLPAVVR